jgi:hypothetical protein
MNEDGHVSISRRGLIAAGLAVAVVGTLGVVSTMNAGAAENPTASVAGDDAADDPAQVPPALLPWGAVPHPVKKGRTGASSEALAAAGASAASDDTSSSRRVTAFGPKGESRHNGVLKTSETSVPPLPPARAKAAAAATAVDYLYTVGQQSAVADGVGALFTIAKPTVAAEDWHSLAEAAVQSADGLHAVEVGWTVDRSTFGDAETHLFVYHWVDGQPTCYGCDFVQYSKTVTPGAILAEGAYKQFGIQHFNGAWWIAYDSEWIGSFPDKLWGSRFVQSGTIQVFGEVAASSTKPCTEMGNGNTPDSTAAARIGSVAYVNGPTVALKVTATTDVYATSKLSDRTFRYGGPGAC